MLSPSTSNGWIDISPLLKKLEEILRGNVNSSINSFKGDFSNTLADNNLNEEGIRAYFKDGSPETECYSAAKLVMAHGVILSLKNGEFDKLKYKLSYFNKPGYLIEKTSVPAPSEMLTGDWGYIRNYDDYLAKNDGPWQGENIIKVATGSDMYWGLGGGSLLSYEQWENLLKSHYKGDRTRAFDPKKREGFLPDLNAFIKVYKLGMDVFDYREKLRNQP